MTDTVTNSAPTTAPPRWLPWLGLALVILAPLAYFPGIEQPLLRRTALLTWLVLAAGLAIGGYCGLRDRRAWIRGLLAVEVAIAGLFVWAFFGLAALPDGAPLAGQAPAWTLPDHTGKPIVLAEKLRNGPLLLVFYRGFW
jgi:hypothetical protein